MSATDIFRPFEGWPGAIGSERAELLLSILRNAVGQDDEAEAEDACEKLDLINEAESALEYFVPAAEEGNLLAAKCAAWLAWQLSEDEETWLERGVAAGDLWSMRRLARLIRPLGREEEAVSLFTRAAEAGDIPSMNSLGIGDARAGRTAEAAAWFRRAAEGGDVNAMANLGLLHVQAEETAEARVWLTRAAEAGHRGARADLERLPV